MKATRSLTLTDRVRLPKVHPDESTLHQRLRAARTVWLRSKRRRNMDEINRLLDEMNRKTAASSF